MNDSEVLSAKDVVCEVLEFNSLYVQSTLKEIKDSFDEDGECFVSVSTQCLMFLFFRHVSTNGVQKCSPFINEGTVPAHLIKVVETMGGKLIESEVRLFISKYVDLSHSEN